MHGLSLRHVSKSFGSHVVLDDISLDLKAGELLVLLGPSGCGKSTLLRLVAGLEAPDSGEIYIDDRRVDRLPPKDRQVAMVFQNYSLYPHMSVEKNLAFPLKVSGVSEAEITQRVTKVAQMLGLSEKLSQRPAQLSGGQRQRVALGRAIIRKPLLFLLDEPLSNLDADLRVRMRSEIVRVQRELAVTTVHVTHDQAEALTMADRIALLNNGRLEQIDTPQQLYVNPKTVFVAQFLGQPRINILSAACFEDHTHGRIVIPEQAKHTENLSIAVRPEAITLDEHGEFQGEVVSSEYLGDQYVIRVSFRGEFLAVSGCRKEYAKGDIVNFRIPGDSVLYFDQSSGMRL